MEIKKTRRGFSFWEFNELYGHSCSIQKSSLATEDAIWLGIDDPDTKIMKKGEGWVEYPIPNDVHITTRMHLSIEHVKKLLPILKHFVETGEI